MTTLRELTSEQLAQECPTLAALPPLSTAATVDMDDVSTYSTNWLPVEAFSKRNGRVVHLLRSCHAVARAGTTTYVREIHVKFVSERSLCKACLSRIRQEASDGRLEGWLALREVVQATALVRHVLVNVRGGVSGAAGYLAAHVTSLRSAVERLRASDPDGFTQRWVDAAESLCAEAESSDTAQDQVRQSQIAACAVAALLSMRGPGKVPVGTPETRVGRVSLVTQHGGHTYEMWADTFFNHVLAAARDGEFTVTGDTREALAGWLHTKAQSILTHGPLGADCLPEKFVLDGSQFEDAAEWVKAEWRLAFTEYLNALAEHWARTIDDAVNDPGVPTVVTIRRAVGGTHDVGMAVRLLSPYGYTDVGGVLRAELPAVVAGTVRSMVPSASVRALNPEDQFILQTALELYAPGTDTGRGTLAYALRAAELVCA